MPMTPEQVRDDMRVMQNRVEQLRTQYRDSSPVLQALTVAWESQPIAWYVALEVLLMKCAN